MSRCHQSDWSKRRHLSEIPPATDYPQSGPPSAKSQSTSGRQAVLIIFGFGLLMVGALWLYWELYTRPFRPLQNAIAARFPDCRPNVIGGQYKSHQTGTPRILRVVLQMPTDDFDPTVEIEQSEERALELARLTSQYISLSAYDVLEIHLVQRLPEQSPRHWSRSRGTGEWEKRIDSHSHKGNEGVSDHSEHSSNSSPPSN